MAITAAGFCHPRLSVFAEAKRPSQMGDRELEQAIAIAEEERVEDRGRAWPLAALDAVFLQRLTDRGSPRGPAPSNAAASAKARKSAYGVLGNRAE